MGKNHDLPLWPQEHLTWTYGVFLILLLLFIMLTLRNLSFSSSFSLSLNEFTLIWLFLKVVRKPFNFPKKFIELVQLVKYTVYRGQNQKNCVLALWKISYTPSPPEVNYRELILEKSAFFIFILEWLSLTKLNVSMGKIRCWL